MIVPVETWTLREPDAFVREAESRLRAADLDESRVEALARAVGLACAEQPRASDRTAAAVGLQAARALSIVGEHEAAASLLAADPLWSPLAGRVRLAGVSPATLSLLCSGMLRPVRWPTVAAGLTLVVDLAPLRADAVEQLDFACLQMAHRLADACCELWQADPTDAALAWRGPSRPASGRRGRGEGPHGALRRAMADRLAWHARRRRWSRAPRVVTLDG